MKNALTLSAVLSFAVVLQAHAALAPSLVAQWGFDEATGITLIDITGKNDATLVGGAQRSEDRPALGIGNRKALSINGQAYMTAPHIALNNKSFTIAGWVKTTAQANQVILSQGDTNRDGRNLVLRLTTGSALQFSFRNDDLISADSMLTKDSWHHVAFSFDKNTRQRRIYVDGTVEAMGTASGVYLATTGQTEIGRWNKAPFGAEYWQGGMDTLSIYNQVLSAEEIKALAVVSAPNAPFTAKSSSSSSSVRQPSVLTPTTLTRTERAILRRAQRKIPQVAKSSSSISRAFPVAPVVWTASSSSSKKSVSAPKPVRSATSSVASSHSSAASVMPASAEGPVYEVSSFQLHLRKDSRATAMNIRTLMPKDKLVVLQMLKNGWAKVKTMDNVEGYVNASFIVKVQP